MLDLILRWSNSSNMFGNLSILRVFRIFRLCRLVRIVRLLKQLNQLVWGLVISLKTLLWALLLLSLLVFIFAVGLCEVKNRFVVIIDFDFWFLFSVRSSFWVELCKVGRAWCIFVLYLYVGGFKKFHGSRSPRSKTVAPGIGWFRSEILVSGESVSAVRKRRARDWLVSV